MRKRDIIVLAAILYIGKAVLDTIGDAIGIMCKGICKELIKKQKMVIITLNNTVILWV